MNTKPITYNHHLGGGIYLEAISVDPKLTERDLAELLTSKEGTAQLESDAIACVRYAGSVDRFSDLSVHINLERTYVVPPQLQAYRDAVQKNSDAKGRYNGPVAIIEGAVEMPLRLMQGGYYDFIATKLGNVPHDLAPESYPSGKTVAELFGEWGIDREDRARYLGFAQVLVTESGAKLNLVQRAKGMAIAPDCIAFSGSTPNPKFVPGFDFHGYCRQHINDEMDEEFQLKPEEFTLAGVHLFDDRLQSPFAALEINTPQSTRSLAERIHGDAQAIKEHPVLYSVPLEGIDAVLNTFPVFPSTVQVLRTLMNR